MGKLLDNQVNMYLTTLWIRHSRHVPSCFSPVQLLGALWTAALQATLSTGFSGQEYWSGLPCPPPGDLLEPGTEPSSSALQADFFYHLSHQGSPTIDTNVTKVSVQEVSGQYKRKYWGDMGGKGGKDFQNLERKVGVMEKTKIEVTRTSSIFCPELTLHFRLLFVNWGGWNKL